MGNAPKFHVGKKKGKRLPGSFRGWPQTYRIADPLAKEGFGIEVYDSCLPPGGARMADVLAGLAILGAGADMAILAMKVNTLEFFIPAAAGVAVFYFVARGFLRWLLARALWMRFYEDRIEVAGWGSFARFPENPGYGSNVFRLDEHERAVDEDVEVRQRPQTGRYYSNSQRLFLDHGRQPFLLAEIYPKDRARALYGRLHAIQEGLRLGVFS